MKAMHTMPIRHALSTIAAIVLAGLVLLTSVASGAPEANRPMAGIPNANGVYAGCYQLRTGALRVVSSGAEIEGGTLAQSDLVKLFLVYSKPVAGLTGWTAQAVEASTFGETWALAVYAICATVAP